MDFKAIFELEEPNRYTKVIENHACIHYSQN